MRKSSIPPNRRGHRDVGDLGKAIRDAVGGLVDGLSEMAGRLGGVAEKGETISKAGGFTIEGDGPGRGPVKAAYNVTIKAGGGPAGARPSVEPVATEPSTGRRQKAARGTAAPEIKEPSVDVFDEVDHILIVAEMPGVAREDVTVSVHPGVLTLSAERGDKRYRRKILLPAAVDEQRVAVSSRNGIFEIKCPKSPGDPR